MKQDIAQIIKERGMEGIRFYYATYIGQVTSIEDDKNINKITVHIPEIDPKGNRKFEPLPKGIPAGKDYGFNYTPKLGEYVFITFRHGMLKYPLWEPGYWAIGERPEEFNSDVVGYKFRDGTLALIDEKESTIKVQLPSGEILNIGKGKFKIANESQSLGALLSDLFQELIQAVILTPVGPGTFSPDTILKLGELHQRMLTLLDT